MLIKSNTIHIFSVSQHSAWFNVPLSLVCLCYLPDLRPVKYHTIHTTLLLVTFIDCCHGKALVCKRWALTCLEVILLRPRATM